MILRYASRSRFTENTIRQNTSDKENLFFCFLSKINMQTVISFLYIIMDNHLSESSLKACSYIKMKVLCREGQMSTLGR